MENNLGFIEKMTKYFGYIDENFMDGYIKIIRCFYNYLINKGIINSSNDIRDYSNDLVKRCSIDKGVSFNKSIEKSLAFFHALNPKYGSAATNLVNEISFVKGNSMYSHSHEIEFGGNEFDAPAIVHEITHDFVVSKEQASQSIYKIVPDDQFSTIRFFIKEINPYINQFLFYDYCEKKDNNKLDRRDLIYDMLAVAENNRKIGFLEETKEVFEILSSGNVAEGDKKVLDYFSVDSSQNSHYTQTYFANEMLNLSHPFGIIVSCYIYQKFLEDPNNIKMYLGLEKAQTIRGDESITLNFLGNLGIPCFKNGKVSLDEESVSALFESLIKTFDMCMNNKREKNNNIFERCPIINDMHIVQVNQILTEAEQTSHDSKNTHYK